MGEEFNGEVQWGVRRTWPDGHTEHESRSSRQDAEVEVRCAGSSTATTVLVSRTCSPWVVVVDHSNEVAGR